METKNIYSRKQNRQLQKEFAGEAEFGFGTGSSKKVVTKTGSSWRWLLLLLLLLLWRFIRFKKQVTYRMLL